MNLSRFFIDRPIFAGVDTASIVESERVGPIAVSYKTSVQDDAAGLAWPWLRGMLAGLVSNDGGALRRVVRA